MRTNVVKIIALASAMTVLVSSCSTFSDGIARARIDELDKRITELDSTMRKYIDVQNQELADAIKANEVDLVKLETVYADARKYYSELAASAGYADPADLIRYLNKADETAKETLAQFEANLALIQEKGQEIQKSMNLMAIGFDERSRKASQDLETVVVNARKSLELLITGFDKAGTDYRATFDMKLSGMATQSTKDMDTYRKAVDLQLAGMSALITDYAKSLVDIRAAFISLGNNLEKK